MAWGFQKYDDGTTGDSLPAGHHPGYPSRNSPAPSDGSAIRSGQGNRILSHLPCYPCTNAPQFDLVQPMPATGPATYAFAAATLNNNVSNEAEPVFARQPVVMDQNGGGGVLALNGNEAGLQIAQRRPGRLRHRHGRFGGRLVALCAAVSSTKKGRHLRRLVVLCDDCRRQQATGSNHSFPDATSFREAA